MNKLTKRLLSLAVVVVMIMTMMPTTLAVEEQDATWTEVATEAELVAAAADTNVSHIKVTADLTLTGESAGSKGLLVVTRDLTLDLGGNTISSTAAFRFMRSEAIVTVQNGSITMPGITGSGNIFYSAKGTFTLDNVVVTKKGYTTENTATNNGGILYASAETMIKDSILKWDSTSTGYMYRGGTIYINGADVTLENSEINGGRAYQHGGNVQVNSGGTLTINNSLITGGSTQYQDGGNVYLGYQGSTVTLNSGAIIGGTAKRYGGNVAVSEGGTFTMNGGYVGTGKGNSNGDNLYLAKDTDANAENGFNTAIYVYGGTIGDGSASSAKDDIYQVVTDVPNVAVLQVCNGYTYEDPSAYMPTCASVEDDTFADANGGRMYMIKHANGECATCGHTYTDGNAHVHTYHIEPQTCSCGESMPSKTAYCADCGTNATWIPWVGSPITKGGHYYMTQDTRLEGTITIDAKVCLDLNDYSVFAAEGARAFYVTSAGTLNVRDLGSDNSDRIAIIGATFYAGHGASIYNAGVLNMDGVEVSDGHAFGTPNSAGNIYSGGSLNLERCHITRGTAGNYAGNMYLSGNAANAEDVIITNTTISDGTSANMGGNMYITGKNTTVRVDNSFIMDGDGSSGGNLAQNTGAQVNMDSTTFIGGTSHSKYGDSIYVRGNSGSQASALTLKNSEVQPGTTDTDDISVMTPATVTILDGCTVYKNPSSMVDGCDAYVMDNTSVEGVSKYTTYANLADALAAAQPQNTVSLLKDEVTAGAVEVPVGVTLNLYGKTLIADSVTAAFDGAQVKDSKGTGKIVSDSVSLMADNNQLPVKNGTEYTFETVEFAQNLNAEAGLYKFYIKGEAAATAIDDAILAGEAVSIDIVVTWTNGLGQSKAKTFTLDSTLLAQYAGNWDTKMITLTFVDLTNVTDLTCTAQIVANGVTVTA